MVRKPKVWTVKQACAYTGNNALSKYLIKRKIPVPPIIKKRGHGRPKQMRGRKKSPIIHRDGSSCVDMPLKAPTATATAAVSTEAASFATDNRIHGGIEYRPSRSACGDMQLRTLMPTAMATATASCSLYSHVFISWQNVGEGGRTDI